MTHADLHQELLTELTQSLQLLPDKPEETASTTLHTLWLLARGEACSVIASAGRDPGLLNQEQIESLRKLIVRRCGGEPLSHIVGRQHFMGLEMLAGPDALVPRVETELLARVALHVARKLSIDKSGAMIIDVCTGSGNVALALAHHLNAGNIYAADLSSDAIELAQKNALHLGLSDMVQFRAGDLLDPFREPQWLGKVDLLTCNPPYISSNRVKSMPSEISSHEPSIAFDGGPFGVSILMRLLQQAPDFLRAGGVLAFEVGLGQGPAMLKRLSTSGAFVDAQAHVDAAGNVRVVSAHRG